MFKSPIFWALIFLGAICAFTIGGNIESSPKGREIASFQLTDSHGKTVTNADLQDKVTLIYFGFTFCPDYCPTTLGKMSNAITHLEENEGVNTEDVQIWFVSVDPQRDTPEVLLEYANLINPEIRTMSGSPAELAAMQKIFGVAAEKNFPAGTADDYYLINHTISTLLLNRSGEMTQRIAESSNVLDFAYFIEKTL